MIVVKFIRFKRLNTNDLSKYNLRRTKAKGWIYFGRYSCDHNCIQTGKGLDGVSACGTLRPSSVHNLLLVSKKYGSDHSFFKEDLPGIWDHALPVIIGRRNSGFSDRESEKTAGTVGKAEQRPAGDHLCFN